jgi:Leucine-rich repeat (LRR) protein
LSRNYLTQTGNILEFSSLLWLFNTLDLSSNRFESLNFSFHNFVALKYLYLNQNRLVFLEEKILLVLDISNNLLTSLEQNIFRSLINLEYLNISSNKLNEINFDQFASLVNVGTLDLSNNSLEYLHPKTFENSHHLQDLYLHMNRIKRIDKLYGFDSIKNIFIDLHLILINSSNVFNLEESILVRLYTIQTLLAMLFI